MGTKPQYSTGQSMMLMTALTLGGIVLMAGPAVLLAGRVGVISVVASAIVCLLPGLVLFGLHGTGFLDNPLMVLLVGTFARMGTALLACVVARVLWPALRFQEFHLWLALMYFLTLGVETHLVTRLSSTPGKAE